MTNKCLKCDALVNGHPILCAACLIASYKINEASLIWQAEKRILDLLRSSHAQILHESRLFPVTPAEWATWLEGQLKE